MAFKGGVAAYFVASCWKPLGRPLRLKPFIRVFLVFTKDSVQEYVVDRRAVRPPSVPWGAALPWANIWTRLVIAALHWILEGRRLEGESEEAIRVLSSLGERADVSDVERVIRSFASKIGAKKLEKKYVSKQEIREIRVRNNSIEIMLKTGEYLLYYCENVKNAGKAIREASYPT